MRDWPDEDEERIQGPDEDLMRVPVCGRCETPAWVGGGALVEDEDGETRAVWVCQDCRDGEGVSVSEVRMGFRGPAYDGAEGPYGDGSAWTTRGDVEVER